MEWRCGSYAFDPRMPIVMGVLNVTPDSFSDGGAHADLDSALAHARALVDDGAQIIDVGGESTRPGAAEVSCEEERARVVDVVRRLADQGICVSIDTRHAPVAQACVDAGASIINDVSGFSDPAMVRVAADADCGCVVMHMRGTPATMQRNTAYDDIVAEVKDYLSRQAALLESHGVDRARICIDPGPGFGKSPEETLVMMRNLQEFARLGYPVMCAPSRKSYVGRAYGIDEPSERDEASAAEALLGCELGATVLRMHNVATTMEALKGLRPYVFLGLGANAPLVAHPGEETEGKIANLNQAISALCTLPDTQIVDISRFYESEPAYFEDQDPFVNAVVLARTGIAPKELLGYLHAIERSLGRVREVENGPRTCDIDILDYQMHVVGSDALTLPHPRILERDFVVKPLMELAPTHVLADGTAMTSDQVKYGAAHAL